MIISSIFSNAVFAQNDNNIHVVVNGKQLTFDQNPVMVDDRVLVPIRKICDEIGAEIYYENYGSAVISIIKGDRFISLCNTILSDSEGYPDVWQISECTLPDRNNAFCKISNATKEREVLDVQPIIANGRTLVPVRIISEYLGGTVNWDGGTKTVTIDITVSTPRSEQEIQKIDSFNQETAREIYKSKVGTELFGTVKEVYNSKGKGYLFGNICVYYDGTVDYLSYDDIVFVGESDKYSRYCGSYSKNYSTQTINLSIFDVCKNRVVFYFNVDSLTRITETTAGRGYFTGENTAEASGTYSDSDGDYDVKYYFVFGDDYIDFKYELYGKDGFNYSPDAEFIKFNLNK